MLARRLLANLAYGGGTIIAFTLVWWVISLCVKNELILPTPWHSLSAVGGLLGYGGFWRGFGMTLLRMSGAFAASTLLAFGFAVLCNRFSAAKKILSVVMTVVRALPSVAIVLMMTLWVSTTVAPIIVTSCIILPMLYGMFVSALESADPLALEMARSFNVPRRRILSQVILPSALSIVIPGMGNNLSLALKTMVAAETLAATAVSIGGLLQQSGITFRIDYLYALVMVTVFTALILEGICAVIAKKAVRWK